MLEKIQHIVVLMLENRSFDHMLGMLYAETRNRSPATGHAFEGLVGNESNPDAAGKAVPVFPIHPKLSYAYFTPGADPGEGYAATNDQLFGSTTAPTPPVAANTGFVTDFAYTLGWQQREGWTILPGTTADSIMGVFTPAMLPVLSGLARGYAVCDHWFASVPTETMPNRAFACAATSQGRVDDKTHSFTVPSIFGHLTKSKITWAVYGYDAPPLTRQNFPDTVSAPDANFGLFPDFQKAAAAGTLPAFTFLEPSWSSTGNSQHPNYDVALGEQLIHDVYHAVRSGPGWKGTLLVIVYDEHGGCYDHVPPPTNAVPPDATPGENGFDFKRFGPRVPAVLVSPLIAPGTVFRAAGPTPLDHTSILKTVERRWKVPSLTARDAAAPDLGAALTLASPRTDDPLEGVVVPKSGQSPFSASAPPSHLQQIHAELVSRLPVPDDGPGGQAHAHQAMSALKTSADAHTYIVERTEAWKRAKAHEPKNQ
jgi:phospholipase C